MYNASRVASLVTRVQPVVIIDKREFKSNLP